MEIKTVFRQGEQADRGRIWQIILQAKEQMRLAGKKQWQDGYPAMENIDDDLERGYGYVLVREGRVAAYGAVVFDGEPAYGSIRGQWLSAGAYVVVHRLAVADEMKRQGMAGLFMQEVEALARQKGVFSFKVDTNFDNFFMMRLMDRLGFTYCGEIMYEGAARRAYEKDLRE